LDPVSRVAESPLRVENRTRMVDDGAGGLLEQKFKFPVWFEPVAEGKTPMCQALDLAYETIADFLRYAPECFPPMVIHMTDGKPSDGIPIEAAKKISQLMSTDGHVLLFNLHLSSSVAPPFVFPDTEIGLPDDLARMLFRMSSELPERLLGIAEVEGFPVKEGSRGFAFNADLVSVIRFLDIGTRVATTVR
jgi:hypothetical protein